MILRRFFADALSGVIHASQMVLFPLLDTGVSEADVVAALADFDELWKTLKTREQSELLQLFVASVEFDAAENSLAMQFHTSAIKGLA